MYLLLTASQAASDNLGAALREGRFPDDWPALVLSNLQRITGDPARMARVRSEMESRRSGWFTSHPGPGERLAAARAIGGDGLFHSDESATVLFQDFTRLARATTRDFFDSFAPIEKGEIVASEDLAKERARVAERAAALARFLGGSLPAERTPLPRAPRPGAGESPADPRPKPTPAELLAERDRTLAAARELRECGDDPTRAAELLMRLEREIARRFQVALELATDPERRIRAGLSDDTVDRLRGVWLQLAELGRRRSAFDHLRRVFDRLIDVDRELAIDPDPPIPLQSEHRKLSVDLGRALTDVRDRYDDLAYPFAKSALVPSVGCYLVPVVSADLTPEITVDLAMAAMDAMDQLQLRLLADSASIVERLERVAGDPKA
jgi:hypothetical protein